MTTHLPTLPLLYCVLAAMTQLSCARLTSPTEALEQSEPPVAEITGDNTRSTSNPTAVADYDETIEILRPLHKELSQPLPGDWLSTHDEPGQSFREFISGHDLTDRNFGDRIHILPIGDFTPKQQQIIELVTQYLEVALNRPVRLESSLPLTAIPPSARRNNGQPQLLTTYILHDVLKPRFPDGAGAMIALTATDLWPGPRHNFAFGQASLTNRVGVWSIYRLGDPDRDEEAFRRCLRRSLKVASHETGHLFGMKHCTAFECNMCGANGLGETDRHPLYYCPQCHAKICWATRGAPVERFRRLADFCNKNGLEREREYFVAAYRALAFDDAIR